MEENNSNIQEFLIDWDKIKTIKEIKEILCLFAEKIVVDLNNPVDVVLYNNIKKYLVD